MKAGYSTPGGIIKVVELHPSLGMVAVWFADGRAWVYDWNDEHNIVGWVIGYEIAGSRLVLPFGPFSSYSEAARALRWWPWLEWLAPGAHVFALPVAMIQQLF